MTEKAKREAELKLDAELTIDKVVCGEQQPESDHFIAYSQSNIGNTNGIHWRETTDYFTYTLNLSGAKEIVITMEKDANRNFTLEIDGKKLKAVLKDVQYHAVSDAIEHIDFLEVNDTKPVSLSIPVKLNGLAEGVKQGGKLVQKMRKLRVKGLLSALPDILNLNHSSLLIYLPAKITIFQKTAKQYIKNFATVKPSHQWLLRLTQSIQI